MTLAYLHGLRSLEHLDPNRQKLLAIYGECQFSLVHALGYCFELIALR